MDQRMNSTPVFDSERRTGSNATSRITRAAARQAASYPESANHSAGASVATPASRISVPPKKRKAPVLESSRASSPVPLQELSKVTTSRRPKRQKVVTEPNQLSPPNLVAVAPSRRKKSQKSAVMSSPGDSAGPSNDHAIISPGPKRKLTRNRKNAQDSHANTPSSSRRFKKNNTGIKEAEHFTPSNPENIQSLSFAWCWIGLHRAILFGH